MTNNTFSEDIFNTSQYLKNIGGHPILPLMIGVYTIKYVKDIREFSKQNYEDVAILFLHYFKDYKEQFNFERYKKLKEEIIGSDEMEFPLPNTELCNQFFKYLLENRTLFDDISNFNKQYNENSLGGEVGVFDKDLYSEYFLKNSLQSEQWLLSRVNFSELIDVPRTKTSELKQNSSKVDDLSLFQKAILLIKSKDSSPFTYAKYMQYKKVIFNHNLNDSKWMESYCDKEVSFNKSMIEKVKNFTKSDQISLKIPTKNLKISIGTEDKLNEFCKQNYETHFPRLYAIYTKYKESDGKEKIRITKLLSGNARYDDRYPKLIDSVKKNSHYAIDYEDVNFVNFCKEHYESYYTNVRPKWDLKVNDFRPESRGPQIA